MQGVELGRNGGGIKEGLDLKNAKEINEQDFKTACVEWLLERVGTQGIGDVEISGVIKWKMEIMTFFLVCSTI